MDEPVSLAPHDVTLPPANELLSRLATLGYEGFGEAGVPGRVYLRLRNARDFNLHVPAGGARLLGHSAANNPAVAELLSAAQKR